MTLDLRFGMMTDHTVKENMQRVRPEAKRPVKRLQPVSGGRGVARNHGRGV